MVSFEDFKKLDLRIGKILTAEDHPRADKLYVLKVDLGEKQIQLVAGIKPYYQKDSLIGKKIAVVVNLEPRSLRGVISEGMLLAATDNITGKVYLLTVQEDIAAGSKIS